MTREAAIELARKHARLKPQSYYQSEAFMPHEWVIDAIMEAHEQGGDDEFNVTESFKHPPGLVHLPWNKVTGDNDDC